MKNLRLRFFSNLFLAFILTAAAAQAQQRPSLIPQPVKLVAGQGSFVVLPSTTLFSTHPDFKNEAAMLGEIFTGSFGRPLLQASAATAKQIRLQQDKTISAAEGYKISITQKGIVLSAGTSAGMFRAVQTIRQLLPPSIEQPRKQASLALPVIEIEDAPAYGWRGVHIDVSRHFFSMAYLRKLVDLMALYKLNKFHLHLTDDQGWRVEIKKYPKLTEEGAWRSFNNQDSACMRLAKENPDFIIDPKHIIRKNGKTLYGGFYTQAELKDLVAYATARHVEIIPEIDMPGHMMAAINSYNYLSCDGTNQFGEFFSTPVCPCNPATLEFAKNIFTEIMDIFPSQYIHIGGDEVDRTYWGKSEACKALMEKEGMKNTAELQSWFIRQMEGFFHEHGKKLIGWDEILEGGVSQTAAIMYWRTWVPNAPSEAAKHGNNVIMTPGNPMYFSQTPDKNSLPAVYHYNIVPDGLTAAEAKNIIGTQANLWSENIPTEQRADYLYMPRLTTLAEISWSHQRDYQSYLSRLNDHYKRLDLLHVSYRLPDLELLDEYAFTGETELAVKKPLEDLTIRYTLDGSLPTMGSMELKRALPIRESQFVRLAAFTKTGRRGDVQNVNFKKQSWAKAESLSSTQPGLIAHWYKRAFDSTMLITGTPDDKFTVAAVVVPQEARVPSFSLQYRGFIQVPQQGIYTFYLLSDDASRLRIAGRDVISNDGMHAPRERNGQVALQKGLQAFALDFIEGGGGFTLKLQYSLNGSAPKDIPADWFRH